MMTPIDYQVRTVLLDLEGPVNVTLCDANATCNVTDGTWRMEAYSSAHLVVTSLVLGSIILATIIGNVFVIAAIILERNLQNVANYLIASLAVADLLVAALVMPLAAVNEVSQAWFLGGEVCDMWISFDVLCCTSIILHLVCIGVDRYWAVTRVDYIQNRSAKRILAMIVLSWGISACISIPPLFGWKDGDNSVVNGLCLISQDWGYTVYSTVGAFYLPLSLLVIIYIKIFRAARSRIRRKRFKTAAANYNSHDPATPRPLLEGSADCSTNLQVPTTPNHGSNSDMALDDRNNILLMTPPPSPAPHRNGSWLDITKVYFENKKFHSPKTKKVREKLEQKRERKAARTLGIITGSFVVCWLPFFIVAIVRPFCGNLCHYPEVLMSIIGWLGYINSLLNPIIYTVFNPDFRSAFRKILFGKYHRRR